MNIMQILPKGNISGIGRYVVNISKGLKKRGHKVVVILKNEKFQSELKSAGIKYYEFSCDLLRPIHTLKMLKDIVTSENIEIINVQHRAALTIFGYLIHQLKNIPYLTTIHNPKPADRIKVIFGGKKIITLSSGVTEHLVNDLHVNKDRIFESFLGVDTEIFRPAIDFSRQMNEFQIPPNAPVVTFISRLSYRKGAIALKLIEAVKLISNEIYLLIVGDGPLLNKLKKISNKKIIVCGTRNDIPQIINMSNVVIGTATVAFEAMACSKPVIGFGRYGYIGIITPENFEMAVKTCFGDHKSIEGYNKHENISKKIATAIEKLINNPDYSRMLGNFGREQIEKKFNIEKMAENLEQIYEGCK